MEQNTEWRCKCNKVIIRFYGEPFMYNNCHCTFCFPIAQYIDKKGDGISSIAHKTGVAKAMFNLNQIKEFIGKDLLIPLKYGPNSENIRAYTKCCNTLCICDGGKKLDFCFRPFNRNCLYFTDGTLYKPKYLLIWNTQGGDNEKYDKIPEPKDPDLPKHLLDIVTRNIDSKQYGDYKQDTSPGFYCNPDECKEYIKY